MRKLFFILILVLVSSLCHAQSISPNESTEFCPNVNITFTVTLPKIAIGTTPSVASWTNGPIVVSGVSNLTSTSTQTTFTFVGKFRDVNINQVFKVDYTPSGGSATSYYISFKRIKSLYYGNTTSTSCLDIQPNVTSITAPRCQISNFAINFANVKWSTFGESPPFCFGTITSYEYQLPSGWKIGTAVSTGSNWIPGGNSVTVTSDLSNGHGGVIRIGPANDCGTGLANGWTPVGIAISRPAPALSVTGTQDYICSGCNTYTINGMPSGATVQWSLSSTTNASISGCTNCSTVTVCRGTTANAIVTLTATVTHCTFTYTVTHGISLGSPATSPIDVLLVDPAIGRIQVSVDDVPGATSYNWYKNGVLVTSYHGTFAQIPIAKDVCDVYYNISVEAITPCGTSAQTTTTVYVPPCNSAFTVSPNPATTDVTVSTTESKGQTASRSFNEVRIYSLQGTLRKQQRFNNVKTSRINISELPSGTYFVEIVSGTYKERHTLLIHK